MKRPTMLLYRVLLDVGLQISDTIERDYEEICSRYGKEGMSFLTITLPALDDALLKGLSQGRLSRCDYLGFRSFCRRGSLPALLQGFFKRIFHDDGSVRSEPCIQSIIAIRQVSRLFKKVELPCTEKRKEEAYERYKSIDGEVDWSVGRDTFDARLWASITGYLWSDLEELSGKLYCFPGNFGSGATAEHLQRNKRYSVSEWPERAEGSFPLSFHATSREDSEALQRVSVISEGSERPVRVVQVPKTLKTPRTISVEPSYMMLMQQSVAKPLMMYLENLWDFKSIRFTDQTVNQRLAREGSVTGRYSTIDLKDASDRVDLELVRKTFSSVCPGFLKLIEDSRTTRARMPDGTILPLRKFASMGSALCFPIEAMVFFTIIIYAIVKYTGKRPSRRLLLEIAADVSVYGDDIVVPSMMGPVVSDALEAFGLMVNGDKSFHSGFFRESCGGDYYKGVNVTPVYVRHWDDTGHLSSSLAKCAYTSLTNQFYMKGMWHVAKHLQELCEESMGPIPRSVQPIGCIHFASFIFTTNLRWDRNLHCLRVKGLKVKTQNEPDSPTTLDGYLLRAFSDVCVQQALDGLRVGYRSSGASYVQGREQVRGGLPDNSDLEFDGRTFLGQDSHILETRPTVENDITSIRSGFGNEFPNVTYANIVKRDYDAGEVRQLWFEHLKPSYQVSLDTSVKARALRLKRGWTTSPVGLGLNS